MTGGSCGYDGKYVKISLACNVSKWDEVILESNFVRYYSNWIG